MALEARSTLGSVELIYHQPINVAQLISVWNLITSPLPKHVFQEGVLPLFEDLGR